MKVIIICNKKGHGDFTTNTHNHIMEKVVQSVESQKVVK
jgi:hypothetical protein